MEFLCEVIDCFCLFFRHMFQPRSFEAASPHRFRVLIDKKKGTDEVRRDQLTPNFLLKCVSCVTASERPFSETLILLTSKEKFLSKGLLLNKTNRWNRWKFARNIPAVFVEKPSSLAPWLDVRGDLGTLGPPGDGKCGLRFLANFASGSLIRSTDSPPN